MYPGRQTQISINFPDWARLIRSSSVPSMRVQYPPFEHCKSQLDGGSKARATGEAASANKRQFLIIAVILDKMADCDRSWYYFVLRQEQNK